MNGTLSLSGRLTARITHRRAPLAWRLRNTLRLGYLRGLLAIYVIAPIARACGLLTAYGTLRAVLFTFRDEQARAEWADAERRLAAAEAARQPGIYSADVARLQAEVDAHLAGRERIDYGLLSARVITTAFVNFLAGQLQTDTTEIGDFKYHDSGVDSTAEAVGNTAMGTTDGESRATGTQVASTNTYTSVGTISYTTTKAIVEHGLFSSASSTTLLDRSVFAALNVVSGDSIQFTYVLTLTAGG